MKSVSKTAGGISLIAGLLLMLGAIFMSLGLSSNIFIVGLLVTLFSLIELFSAESVTFVSWVNGVLGAWLLVSPAFLVGLTAGVIWASVIIGIIVLGVAIYGGMSASSSIGMGHPKMG